MKRFASILGGPVIKTAAVVLSFTFVGATAQVEPGPPMDHHDTGHDHAGTAVSEHAAMHRHARTDIMRRKVSYAVPDVALVRDDGTAVSLRKELDDGRPVFLTFIYTTCTTICPVVSQTFSQLQTALGPEQSKVHLMSISIDPEQDTPARLKEYAHRFGAGPQWQHYTGTTEASIAAQRAFDVYRGDKMNHDPVTLMRVAPGQPWLRIDGFVSANELVRDYHSLTAG